jgi:TPR repeat protein
MSDYHYPQNGCPKCARFSINGLAKIWAVCCVLIGAAVLSLAAPASRAYAIPLESASPDINTGIGPGVDEYEQGEKYFQGSGVDKNYIEAMQQYKKAAEQGHSDAMISIGVIYGAGGNGIQQDHKLEMKWYRQAADSGSAQAMNNIGYMYDEGIGVQQDYNEAMAWYKKAADSGNTNAMNNIGYMYRNGLGVQQDHNEAVTWYKKSADLGNETAKANLASLEIK